MHGHHLDIGILGGTGPEGLGLGARLAKARHSVGIGSRVADRADATARELREATDNEEVVGDDNFQIAERSRVVVVAVPLSAMKSTLAPLQNSLNGKVVVSVVAAIEFVEGRPRPVALEAGSAAQEIAHLLPDSSIAGGFHTLSAEKLSDLSMDLNEDTIICADDRDTRHLVMDLAGSIKGIRPISGGRLSNSYYPELMVGMLATLNRIHKAHSGFRLTGLD